MIKTLNIVSEIPDTIKHDIPLSEDIINFLSYEDVIDLTIPTLYIGYNKTSTLYTINILNKQISEHIWWTFTKQEKISDYFNEITKFCENFFNFYLTHYTYNSFNFLLFPDIKSFNDLWLYITTKKISRIVFTKRSIYIYYDTNIFGIDLYYLYYIDKEKTTKFINILFEKYKTCSILDRQDELVNKYKDIYPNKELIERFIGIFETEPY